MERCETVAYTGSSSSSNSPSSRLMAVKRDDERYLIRVATPQYIASLRSYNRGQPGDNLDETILPLDDVASEDQVCQHLGSIPKKQFLSFALVQQD